MLEDIKQALSKKDIINFLLLGIAALAIPITVGTLNEQRIYKSQASNPPIQIIANAGDPAADTFQTVDNKLVLSDTNNDGVYKVYVQLEPTANLLTASLPDFFSPVKPVYAGHLHIFEDQAATYSIDKRGFPQTFCDENGQNLYKELADGTHEIEEECVPQGKVCAIEQSNTFASPGCFNPNTLQDLGRGCNQHYDCRIFTSDDGLFPIFSDCKITPGACGVSDGGTTKKPNGADCTVDAQCESNNCPTNPSNSSYHKCLGTTPTPTPTPTAAPTQPVIEKFKLAQSIAGLAQATEQAFTGPGQLAPFTFPNPVLGADNFIFVQFIGKDAQGRTTQTSPSNPAMRSTITILGPAPIITGSACNIDVDLKDGSLKFTVLGSNFGVRDRTKSKLLADSSELEVKEWTNQRVAAKMANPPDTSAGKTYTITLKRADGASAEATCDVDTRQVSVEAKVFCRTSTNFDQDNVEMSTFEMVGIGTSIPGGKLNVASSSRETVKIGKNKTINNIKAKIKQGSTFIICLFAPNSIRSCSDPFKAVAEGNNKLANFNLPVGDLNSDCRINAVDAGILKQQWGPVNASKNCDFNGDGKCNSFEWSCMKHDFNSSCEDEPK